MISLHDLTVRLNAKIIGPDILFQNLSTDSRAIKPGDLFVALRGDRFDGHQFIEQAVMHGACAVVVDQPQQDLVVPQLVVNDTCEALGQIAAFNRSKFNGQVIAITGSSGKTSVKGLLREILALDNSIVATPGNFNNHIGVPLSLMQLNTQKRAVMELGTSHPGEIAYLVNLVQPDIALVNNIMPAHIAGFGTLEAIAEEKSSIYSTLSDQQIAVINIDDDFVKIFENKTAHCQRIGYSVEPRAKNYPVLTAKNISSSSNGDSTFDLSFNEETVSVRLHVPGAHSVRNALAAAACALAAGCSLPIIAQGLALFTGVSGRMQRKTGINQACVIDDTYNANSGSVKAAIDYLSSLSGKRILVLGDLGELGELSEQTHCELGQYALQKHIDAVYCCGQFALMTAQGFGGNAHVFQEQSTLVNELMPVLDSSTTVLVKGSRSAHMEHVVKALCQNEEHSAC